MRTILSFLFLSLVPAAAAAQPAAAPAASSDVPAECESIATVPDQAMTEIPMLAARMSMASCAAQARAGSLALTDDADGILQLQNAMGPSLDTFQNLVDDPHPEFQLLAAHAHADLLLGMVTRMRASIPPVSSDAFGVDLIRQQADRDARHESLEPLLRPWIAAARADLVRTLAVAKQHPELANDPVIAAAIQHAEADLAAAS